MSVIRTRSVRKETELHLLKEYALTLPLVAFTTETERGARSVISRSVPKETEVDNLKEVYPVIGSIT